MKVQLVWRRTWRRFGLRPIEARPSEIDSPSAAAAADSHAELRLRGSGSGSVHEKGFTLSETLIAMAVAMIGLLGLFTSAGQAVRIIHTGKQTASASQMLQQRIETFRHARPWSNATTFEGIAKLVGSATASAQTFPPATETFKIEPYPAGGTPMLVRREPNGDLTCTGPDLTGQACVKITATVTWRGYGNSQRTRQLSTILTKGGL